MTSGGIGRSVSAWVLGGMGALASGLAMANPEPNQLNMTKGVSEWSPYAMHMVALWVCVVIGVVVFGAMFIAMFRFRKSRGAVAEKWSHSTKLEVVWTVIPVIILIFLAHLATGGLVTFADTTGSEMTVKVTGYQWKWRYDYVDYKGKGVNQVGFMSKLEESSDRTRQLRSNLDPDKVQVDGYKTYLLDVDKPLVVPVGTKIRFVIIGGDVIHSWWVPALGWKMDAIPGIANTAWTKIKEPGVYRGQCAELCGQDHGFMPIVVKALPKAEFEQWLASQEDEAKAKAAPPAAAPATPNAPAPAPQG
ncbi:cytochrome c oxidase subunit II [Luteibacter aegosomatis]|uniref:cytochrome c oxidase subunit II n=1 Tax=Luteibacter aegosomatis TaxID=2911537 RepID=UPI001FF7DA58|nr:cytochrome c oxidase subunit II [Luteibacter aegosomatis]UPG86211.1 cytochrome c oxidase subunit II [Luteibacter aegosomatis]